ncbi:MAG: hypothetical protein IH830_03335 [Planctomycetes bacterium]|nr:hypothetical protein [Planctomycetota bacterium]
MPVEEAIYVIIGVAVALGAPISFCFYRTQVDIRDKVREVMFKQSSKTLISPVEFMELRRRVRGEEVALPGTNADVLDLLFPKRYWFNCLQWVVVLAAAIAIGVLVYQLLSVGSEGASLASLVKVVDGKVAVSTVVLAGSLVVYVITLLMALNQKKALKRIIGELSMSQSRPK